MSLDVGSRMPGESDSTVTDPGSLTVSPGGLPRPAPVTRTGSDGRSHMVPVVAGLLLLTCCLLLLLFVAALSLGLVSVLLHPSTWAVVLAVLSILLVVGVLSYRRRPHPRTVALAGKGL